MPATTWDIGDSVKLTFEVRDAAGVLTNATVAYLGTKPDGTLDTTAPSTAATGIYTRTFAADQSGTWLYAFTATGAVTTREDGAFVVEANQGATLYVTVGELRNQLSDTGVELDLWQLERAAVGTSRAVDDYCARGASSGPGRFWRPAATEVRVYRPRDACTVRTDDIASATGLVVKTDTALDGTYATTLTAADYQLEPWNADLDGRPWRRICMLNGAQWPWHATRPTVQVTARFGWPTVPEPVRVAARIKAAKLFRRKDSPDGVSGFGELGVVRISRFEDPDVAMLLDAYALSAGSMVA